jgi:hypothetical protein
MLEVATLDIAIASRGVQPKQGARKGFPAIFRASEATLSRSSPVSFQTVPTDPVIKRVETVGRVQPHVKAKVIHPSGETVKIGKSQCLMQLPNLFNRGFPENRPAGRTLHRRISSPEGVRTYPTSGVLSLGRPCGVVPDAVLLNSVLRADIGMIRNRPTPSCVDTRMIPTPFGCILVTRLSWTREVIFKVG